VVDDLGEPAEPARDDWCSTGHRLDRREAKKLRDPDLAPEACSMDRRQSDDLRAAVKRGEIGVGDDAEELHVALRGKPSKERRILALGRFGVVSGRSDHAQHRILRERFEQSVDALVRR
jgi:hypothetical protein